DCGTNSIRLLVADVDGSALTDVTRQLEIVRLGQGVDRTGRLTAGALERTRVALKAYADEIARLGAERVRMVATSATRDPVSAGEFHDMGVGTLGIPPEVISGDEEARLSFTGAVRGLPADLPGPYLVVDIGGGSTELVTGRGDATVDAAISVDVGCVRMTERHLHGDPPTPEQVAAAEADIAAAVDRALAVVDGRRAGTLVGLAGSVTTVTAITLGLPVDDPERIHHARVSYADVAKVTADLLSMTREQRLAIPVMHPGRADVIGGGALVLRVIMQRAGFGAVVASEHDILDGIVTSLVAGG